jgi:hypothetical protein
MIKDETLDYLNTLHGWCDEEKMEKLHELVVKCSKDFPDTQLLTVELGIFGGRSLLPMALAHKELQNGYAIGIDSYDNVTPTEGTNAPANNEWWSKLDIKGVFNSFVKATERKEWSGYVKYLKGRSDSFADKFPDNSITLLHQDSNHNVETITKELELFAPKIKMNGYWVIDDADWQEVKEGYAKLPSFGFELVEDFGTWQVWRKTGVIYKHELDITKHDYEVTGSEVKDDKNINAFPTSPNIKGFKTIEEAIASEKVISQEIYTDLEVVKPTAISKSSESPKCGMQIGNYNIKPVALYLSDDEKWLAQYEHAKKYFAEQGVEDIYWLNGVHAFNWGIKGTHEYLLDGVQDPKFYVGTANVGNFISQYMAYNVMDALGKNTDFEYFAYFEGDCEFVEGWKEKLALALEDIPADWDMLYAGNCCCQNKQGVLVSERSGLYHYPNRGGESFWHYYPLCTHFYLVSKKAIPHLIATQRDTANPTDISIARYALGGLKTYAILPRLAGQFNTTLTE